MGLQKICQKAGVPLCSVPTACAGWWATLAVKSGRVHGLPSLATTPLRPLQKHYAQPAAVANAATARVLDRLSSSIGGPSTSEEELLQRLDDNMLEQLTELLGGGPRKAKPDN